MRTIPTSTLSRFSSHHGAAQFLIQNGRRVIGSGGSGAYVLSKGIGRVVYKLSDDPGAAAFAAFLRSSLRAPALPRVFAISANAAPWTCIMSEWLRAPNPQEASAWNSWVQNDYMLNRGNPKADPFGVANLLSALRQQAASMCVGLDVLKPDNVMYRIGGSQIVFSDPFF